MAAAAAPARFWCATSNVGFASEAELRAHYRSDFHRYNLKRRAAGLGPVARDWFELHRAQLQQAAAPAAAAGPAQVWVDPLTKKRFAKEATYRTFVASKKYEKLVKKSGRPAPAPIVRVQAPRPAPGAEEGSDGSGSDGWETASEDGDAEAAEMEGVAGGASSSAPAAAAWDLRRSLFDDHLSESLEENLEYMLKTFGFYFPYVQHLQDPKGLLRYLGAKLAEGHIPLYVSGFDENAKSFRSLQAVQRHMVDSNKCKMLFEGNEDEYEDYYPDIFEDTDEEGEDEAMPDAGERGIQVAGAAVAPADGLDGLELAIPTGYDGRGDVTSVKHLGHKSMARYYKQRHRLQDARARALVIADRYRAMGIATLMKREQFLQARAQMKASTKYERRRFDYKTRAGFRNDKIFNLPKNCGSNTVTR